MGKKSAPKYDAAAAVAAQTKANQQAYGASAKASGKSGPFGSSTYTFDENGQPNGQETDFSAQLGKTSENLQGNVAGMSQYLPQTPFKLSDVPSGLDVAGATFNQGMTYLKPQFAQQNKALESQLYQRGIPIGGNDVYKDATANLSDSQNRATTDLTQRALLMAPQEQQRMIQNALTERNQVGADMGNRIGLLGAMGRLLPQAGSIGNQQAPDAIGAYNNQYQAEAANYAAKNAMYGNLAKLGLGLVTAPMTGGSSLLGMGASSLFNGGGSLGMPGGNYTGSNDPGGSYFMGA